MAVRDSGPSFGARPAPRAPPAQRHTALLALGASLGAIRRSVLSHALALGATGLLAGVGIAATLTRGLRTQLFGVDALDPLTLSGVAVVAVSMTLLAAYFPARRAIRVDPVRALRD